MIWCRHREDFLEPKSKAESRKWNDSWRLSCSGSRLLKLRGICANAHCPMPVPCLHWRMDGRSRTSSQGRLLQAWGLGGQHASCLLDRVSSSINSELTTAWLPVVVMNHYSLPSSLLGMAWNEQYRRHLQSAKSTPLLYFSSTTLVICNSNFIPSQSKYTLDKIYTKKY